LKIILKIIGILFQIIKLIITKMIHGSFGGRLGNQMFQYAIARIVAEKNGYEFYLPQVNELPHPHPEDPSHHIFNFFPNLERGKIDGNLQYIYNENPGQYFDPNLFNAPNFTRLYGYYQTERYFEGYEDKIKEWFKLEADDKTSELLLKYPVEEYCYIHFRVYVFGEGQTYISLKFYLDAMDKIKEIKPDIKFLVITEEIPKAEEVFKDVDCEIISNDMMVDLKLLYFSKYCIISPSTYSWWAAWLTDKYITVAPMYWIYYDKPEKGWFPCEIKSKKFIYV